MATNKPAPPPPPPPRPPAQPNHRSLGNEGGSNAIIPRVPVTPPPPRK